MEIKSLLEIVNVTLNGEVWTPRMEWMTASANQTMTARPVKELVMSTEKYKRHRKI